MNDDEDDEFEFYFSDGNDSLHEQLYDRHGRPYISKKQRKRQALKERVRMSNARLQGPLALVPKTGQHPPQEKPRREPKYKVLRKVMPCEEIPSFIQRVTHDLTHKRPHVPENDTSWNESGVVESAYASSSMNEPYFHNSEA